MLMKKYSHINAGLAFWLLLGAGSMAQAQRQSPRFLPYSTVSFGGGTSTYYGDMAGYGNLIKSTFTLPRWNVGFSYTRQFTPRIAARASLTYARITGDDYNFSQSDLSKYAVIFARNLHFRNDLKEFGLTGLYNFIPEARISEKRPKVSPYIFLGVAVLAHSPEARSKVVENDPTTKSREWVKLQPLGTEGQGQPGYEKPYSLITLAIPAGFGVKWRLNESFNVAAEVGYRYTFTDYLDDLGGNYPAAGALTGLAAQMSDRRLEAVSARVNKDRTATVQSISTTPDGINYFTTAARSAKTRFAALNNDAYLLTTFQIQYIIPTRIKCPPIK